jgi:hypothetical protein
MAIEANVVEAVSKTFQAVEWLPDPESCLRFLPPCSGSSSGWFGPGSTLGSMVVCPYCVEAALASRGAWNEPRGKAHWARSLGTKALVLLSACIVGS